MTRAGSHRCCEVMTPLSELCLEDSVSWPFSCSTMIPETEGMIKISYHSAVTLSPQCEQRCASEFIAKSSFSDEDWGESMAISIFRRQSGAVRM